MPTLTQDDVAAIPSGTAVGQTFSGVYTSVTSSLTGCRCRQGSCGSFQAIVGEQVSVFQTDGSLRVENLGLGGPPELRGGVDEDGTFTFGGSVVGPAETDFIRLQGMFMLTGGKAEAFQATVNGTTVDHSDTRPFDCDFQLESTFRIDGT